jgi:metal-responsive CopG/Arc/MetJ family transcriptional regulator
MRRRADGLAPSSRAARRASGFVRFEVQLPAALLAELDRRARQLGISRSRAVGELVELASLEDWKRAPDSE